MPKGNKLFNIRDCGTCGAPVIDAYDEFTGSSFPVDAQPHDGVAKLAQGLAAEAVAEAVDDGEQDAAGCDHRDQTAVDIPVPVIVLQ